MCPPLLPYMTYKNYRKAYNTNYDKKNQTQISLKENARVEIYN